MTNEQISLLLDLFAQIYNATEPIGVSDSALDAWWKTLAARIDAVNSLVEKEENKNRLRELAENARKVMPDIIDWIARVDRALERRPDRGQLVEIIRKGLDEGRHGLLRQIKDELKQVISDELAR